MIFQINSPISSPRDSFNTSAIKIDTLSELRPLKNIEDSPISGFQWSLILLAILGILGIFYFLLKKYWNTEGIPIISFIKTNPYSWAESQILETQKNLTLHQTTHREYHIRITEIIREFLWKVNEIDAPHSTSSKSLNEFNHNSGLTIEKKKMLKEILELADEIKFSGTRGETNRIQDFTHLALDFVRKSKPSS